MNGVALIVAACIAGGAYLIGCGYQTDGWFFACIGLTVGAWSVLLK